MLALLRLIAWVGVSLGGVLVVVAVATTGVAAWILFSSQPDYDGQDRVSGLQSNVTVIRGEHAIPHIFAENFLDAYRALGYLHAQDRFFQMDFARRLAAGRMSEFAGAGGLRTDRFMRTLGLYRAAEAAAANAAPATRAAIDAYSQGVNAWLGSAHFRKPPELALAATDADPWRPADSLAIGRMMALLLSGNWREELLRAELAKSLTREQIDDLWPVDAPGAPASLPDLSALYRDIDTTAIAAAIPDIYPPASASNAWVVDGNHSASGKPLLANDPHLGFSAPGWWYLARIVTPDGIRVGATLAGQPFIMIGHNGHVAWGLTTTHADTQDLFIEKIDPEDPTRYLGPDGPLHFDARSELIKVRFRSEPEKLIIRESRHGPVISDLNARATQATPEGHVLALAWPALRTDDRTADAIADMNAAKNASAFVAALERFDSPMQNVMFADTAGTIGFYAAARVPIRKAGDGTRPVPGWSGAFDWQGFVPFDALPHAVAPSKGRIVNANNRIVDDNYPFLIAADWPEAFRAHRVHDLLDSKKRSGTGDFVRYQNDNRSYAARALLPIMIDLAQRSRTAPDAQSWLDRLARWDHEMNRDTAEPLVYMAWLRELSRRLYQDELGTAFGSLRGLRPGVVARMLTERQAWCDDIATPTREACSAIVAEALPAALALLRQRLGADEGAWRWGDLHQAAFRHPVVGRVPWLRNLFGMAIETDGGPFTINRGTAALSTGNRLFSHIHGPGLRAVFDLANLDASRFSLSSGQSGHPLSRFYTDTTVGWRNGDTISLFGDKPTLRRNAEAILRLSP